MKAINLLVLLFSLTACATQRKTGDPMIDPILAHQRQFKQCYQESDSYKGHHHVETGTVSIAFTVDPKGHVKGERILDTAFKDANLHACILDVADNIQFPEPKDGQALEISQTLSFTQVVQ